MTRQITGLHDFFLEWSRDETTGGSLYSSSGPPQESGGTEPAVSIFSSIQRLGLKLEPRKVPLDTIVVDRIEKTPTEN